MGPLLLTDRYWVVQVSNPKSQDFARLTGVLHAFVSRCVAKAQTTDPASSSPSAGPYSGCLTEAELAAAGGGIPDAWGTFPRTVLELLHTLGPTTTLHASAIEVYQEFAFDLLNDHAPLTVGTKTAGAVRKGLAINADGMHSGGGHGTHPSTCFCGEW